MNVEVLDNGALNVTLSERNLLDLLAQLTRGESGLLMRVTSAGPLVISAQRDAAHYGDRRPGIGSGLLAPAPAPVDPVLAEILAGIDL